MLKKILCIFFLYLGAASFAFAQTGSLEGTVTNAQTGEPVIGANVLLVEVSRGAATNVEGKYTISDVPVGTYTLRVTFIGYKTIKQEVTISSGETIERNIQLMPTTANLQELVVTALGIERKEESLGTSTQMVEAEELAASPAVGVVNKLAGQTSGLRIVSSSGQPGSAPRIVIRGANSITGNNQPLFVVNGVPISNASSDNPTSSLYYGSGNGMGTDNRSKKFHNVAWKNLKDAGFPDRILWIKAAAQKYPYMDISKVGIYGTSAGGQSAMGALLFHPDFYKVAVSASGCHDNRMDKIWWNEQWMGWPVGPQYAESSNVENAWRLQGDLLLIVGLLDTNVPPASTFQVVDALIKANKDFELLVLPGAGHTSGGEIGRRMRRDFFIKNIHGIEAPDWNSMSKQQLEEVTI